MAFTGGSAGSAAAASPGSGGGAAGGRRSVGQTSPRSVAGTIESLGPPSSSAALPTASIRSVAAHQASNSSSVISRAGWFFMILAPSESKKGADQLAQDGGCRKIPLASATNRVGENC